MSVGVWVCGWGDGQNKLLTVSRNSEHGVAKTSKLAGGKSITKGFRYC